MDNNGWVCNTCLSKNIKILKHKERSQREIDCFCLDCKEYDYIISSYRA